MKAKIYVTLKKGVLDPQGRAIRSSLSHLGIAGVEDVRVGKYMELALKDVGREEAQRLLDEHGGSTGLVEVRGVVGLLGEGGPPIDEFARLAELRAPVFSEDDLRAFIQQFLCNFLLVVVHFMVLFLRVPSKCRLHKETQGVG